MVYTVLYIAISVVGTGVHNVLYTVSSVVRTVFHTILYIAISVKETVVCTVLYIPSLSWKEWSILSAYSYLRRGNGCPYCPVYIILCRGNWWSRLSCIKLSLSWEGWSKLYFI